MATPSEYERRIKSLGLTRDYPISSLAEARAAKADVTQLQKTLRQIKKEIDLDMKVIRGTYAQKMASAAQTSSTVLSLFGKRGLAGQLRADEKRRLSQQRDRELAPYAALKLAIDNQVLECDKAKSQIDQAALKIKTQEG